MGLVVEMTTPYPQGYIPARNALMDPKSSPEVRRAAQDVLDEIEAQRRGRE